jgi:rhomboid family GlyGly-CTERM serine protease
MSAPGLRTPRYWALPLLLSLLCALLQALHSAPLLQYQRGAILHGQYWRLLSGNFVHLGWGHLAHDLVGLWLIWVLFGQLLSTRAWLALLLWDGLAIGLGLLACSPTVHWYVGISAILYGMFTVGCLASLRARPWYAGLLLAGMLALIAWSNLHGPLPAEDWGMDGPVLPIAHLYGAIGGALFMLARWSRSSRRAAPHAGTR